MQKINKGLTPYLKYPKSLDSIPELVHCQSKKF